jgi:hypothetical protein
MSIIPWSDGPFRAKRLLAVVVAVVVWPWQSRRIANVPMEHCLVASGRPLEFRRAGFGGGCVPMIVFHPTRRELTK